MSMELSMGTMEEDKECCSEVVLQEDNSNDDHTSILPEDVMSYILSFLTMRDAVKVRILSTRWRYFCAATFDLYFDPFTVFGVTWDSVCFNRKLWDCRLRFVRAVDQVLQFCNMKKLESFRVRYSLGNEYASHINSWVIFAVTMHTEKFHLDFSHVPESCERYNFPCHSLLQGELSKLKHLTLEACNLRPHPDSIKCFNSLTKLELHDMMPLDQSDLHNILLGCISLEFLKLKLCRLSGCKGSLYIRGQPKLRWLIVESCSGPSKIEISSINLTKFEYTGFERTFKFIGVPYLEKVFLNRHWWSRRFLTEVAENFPQIQDLTLVIIVSQRIQRPQLPTTTTFQHVIKLNLIVCMIRGFDIRSIIFILNVFPHLQRFYLMMQNWNKRKEVEWEYSEQLYHHLKKVEICGFFDECNMLELAIYLMNNAVVLEQMVINSRRVRYYGGGQWSQSSGRTMSRDERNRIHKVLSKEKVNRKLRVIVK